MPARCVRRRRPPLAFVRWNPPEKCRGSDQRSGRCSHRARGCNHGRLPGVYHSNTMQREANSTLARLHDQRARFRDFVARRSPAADVDDILAEAFARAVRSIAQLEDPDRATAWFYRIARNVLLDRADARRRESDALAMLAKEIDGLPLEETAVCACSLGLLGEVRSEYADILQRVDVDEQSLAEAAQALGITTNNATVRLHRARASLREKLRAACNTDSLKKCLECVCDA